MLVFPNVLFLVSFLHDTIAYSVKQCIWRRAALCCQLEKIRGWGVDESSSRWEMEGIGKPVN